MYARHQNGQAVRAQFSAPAISYDRDGKPATFWGLQGSASLQGKDLFLTVVNPAVRDPREAEIVIRGAPIKAAVRTTLTHTDIHAHNTFDQPEEVSPQTKSVAISSGALTMIFPPASVSSLMLTLG
jgi:alpha-N-arabinofuranosidase